MPDYKKMYLTMVGETERAVNILLEAQRKCEEMYIASPDPEIKLLPRAPEPPKP